MSRRTEVSIAKDIGVRKPQPGSGAPAGFKGDVRKRNVVRIQDKETAKGSFAVKVSEWQEIEELALRSSEMPSLVVTFSKHNLRLAVIDYEEWLRYVQWLEASSTK